MPTRTSWTQSLTRRISNLQFAVLACAAAILASGCGGDGGNQEVPSTLSIALAGTGRGTVTGSVGGLNCTNVDNGTATGTCQADVDKGTQVTLTATPATGASFFGWSGNNVTCLANAPCNITINDDQTVVATFEAAAPTQTLSVTPNGTGSGELVSDPAGIDCTITSGTAGGTCSASFATGASVELQVASGALVGFGGDCSGTSCSLVMSQARSVIVTFAAQAQPTQLVFVAQPGAVQTSQTMSPPVQVAVADAQGIPVGGRTDQITLAIGTNPGSATLGGTPTQTAANGIATFADLTLNQPGNGYTLTASAAGLPTATSATFNVSPEPVAKLAFAAQPVTTAAGAAIPAVTVEIRDQASGTVLTTRTDQITIALQTNPSGGSLGGSVTATAVSGVATFSNLTIQKAGVGYKLGASTPNAGSASSSAFDILAGPAVQMVRNSSATQSAPAGSAVGERPSVNVRDAFGNPVSGVNVAWQVTVGGGTVKASDTDDHVRPTGVLGNSTALSWTLGPDVGIENNELQASATGPGGSPLTGSPMTFKASGTIPPDMGVFTGKVKRISNAGFVVPTVPIAGASLTFKDLSDTPIADRQGTTNADGSFVSPVLPAGRPYQINITASPTYKAISFAKPALTSGASSGLGDLGMVLDNPNGGESDVLVTVNLDPAPDPAITVTVEVYSGYYFGPSDESLNPAFNSGDSGTQFDVHGNDWGIVTLLVSAEGYISKNIPIVVDEPNSEGAPVTVTLEQAVTLRR